MGLFDFFKKDKSSKGKREKASEISNSSQSVSETFPTTDCPLPPPINLKREDRIAEIPVPPPFPRNRLLKDFFRIDITTVLPHEGETRIILDPPELGIFHYLDFIFHKDGTRHLEFRSLYKTFSKEVIDFVATCANTFGPTPQGETVITPRDSLLLMNGLFSRLWKDIWLDVSTDENSGLKALTLTIFNVDKSAYMVMKNSK